MMTIRHVAPSTHEMVIQTRRVELYPKFASSDEVPAVFYERDDGSSVEVTEGTVYVMNDNGKTVAVYHLKHSEPKQLFGHPTH